jgi:hypothetical protein
MIIPRLNRHCPADTTSPFKTHFPLKVRVHGAEPIKNNCHFLITFIQLQNLQGYLNPTMVFIRTERDPLLQSPQGSPRRASLRLAAYAITALVVVCLAAFTVLEERTPRPWELISSSSNIETQPGQLGGADRYTPRRFSPYVSLSAPELLNAQEKLHEKQLDFFLKSQRVAGVIAQQPGLELSENEPEVSEPQWIRFPRHRGHLASKLQRLANGKIQPIIKQDANMLDSASQLRKDPIFRESGRYDGPSIMDNRRVRLALHKIASRLANFNKQAVKEQHELSKSFDKVGHSLSLRVLRDKDLIVSVVFRLMLLPCILAVFTASIFFMHMSCLIHALQKSESVWNTPGVDDVNAAE